MRTIIAGAIAGAALMLGVGTTGTMAQTPYGSPSESAPIGLDSNPAADVPNQPAASMRHRETSGFGSNCHVVTRHMLRANGDRITVHRRICD